MNKNTGQQKKCSVHLDLAMWKCSKTPSTTSSPSLPEYSFYTGVGGGNHDFDNFWRFQPTVYKTVAIVERVAPLHWDWLGFSLLYHSKDPEVNFMVPEKEDMINNDTGQQKKEKIFCLSGLSDVKMFGDTVYNLSPPPCLRVSFFYFI